MELFNLALLAKQGWRILQNPETLSARILKAVYFPSVNFLEAELGSRPSQIWRAILEGREVLKQGIIRRIGNGRSTWIWADNWLPRSSLLRPVVPLKEQRPVMVSELIDQSSATWRDDMLTYHFLPMDIEVIKQIPIPTLNLEDFWSWHFEKSGVFSVRSAYRMLVHTKNRRDAWLEGRPSLSDTTQVEKAWSKIWKIDVPSKVKFFAWRLAKQSLPMADVLVHREMASMHTCKICGRAEDSWRHSLLECHMARCVWALCDEEATEHIFACQEPHAKQWLFMIMESMPHQDFVKVLVTLWAIWTARRKAVHEDIFQSPLSTYSFITRYLQDLNMVQRTNGKATGLKVHRPKAKWIPPSVGLVKGNVDAAVARSGDMGAVAAIFRNADGKFLGASALVSRGTSDPFTMEAIACREALSLARDLDLQKIVIASDCQAVVQDIEKGCAGPYATVTREIARRRLDFDEVSFHHEAREANFEPHNLARSVLHFAVGRHVWLVEPPSFANVPMFTQN